MQTISICFHFMLYFVLDETNVIQSIVLIGLDCFGYYLLYDDSYTLYLYKWMFVNVTYQFDFTKLLKTFAR